MRDCRSKHPRRPYSSNNKCTAKVSISQLLGTLKGRTAIGVFKQFPYLKQRPYWGNHFWAKGYCVDTIGLNPEMIRKYVQYQEDQERQEGQRSFNF